MSRSLRITLIAAAVPVAIVLWATGVFAMDRVSNSGEVLGTVTVAGTDLGGLDEDEARATLEGLQEQLSTMPISVTVAGQTFSLLPSEVGFQIDVDAMLTEAMANGRDGGVTGQFGWWLGNLGGGDPTQIHLVTGYSQNALYDVLDQWVTESIDNPAFEGGIEVVDGEVRALYPSTGLGIDKEESAGLVAAALVDLSRTPIELPTQVITPTRTNEELDAIVARIEADAADLIDADITLSYLTPPVSVRFDQTLLAESLRARLTDSESDDVELYFDADPLITYLLGIRDQIEQPPQDAEIVARWDEQVTIVPGRSQLLIDESKVSNAVLQAARSATKAGVFPFKEGDPPNLSTQEAEDLHVDGLLYRATTYFTPGGDWMNQNRVKNIQRIAEEADGALVMPGDTFSLNDYVGQRTIEDGYFRAGAIIGPVVQCCDHPANIGGGVSQFTTTMYNAVFFSGLQDVEHTPHTLYFPRYPMGREATLGYPSPDLVFRNNTDAAVLIDTETGSDYVTVRFYGNNGGLEIEAGLSDQRDWVDPSDYYVANPAMDPDAEPEQTSKGKAGFAVTVFRYITYPEGHPDKPEGGQITNTWVWRYDPFPNVFEVHPCKLPEDHRDYVATCPSGVPSVIGKQQSTAVTQIENGGWVADVVTVGNNVHNCLSVSDNGKVTDQSPTGGFLAPEEEVTLYVCNWTTETTTTTAAP
ncbi:MAG: VanW family protein [Actinobacteria bacterium]|nr:VanW family protein [Actinomycetota bacterium]